MLAEEAEYYRDRAQAELMQAARTHCNAASEAHRELARLYSIRADELDVSATDHPAVRADGALLSVFCAPGAASA